MQIKVNGKALLALFSVVSCLSFGEYVTIINAKDAGGIVVEGDKEKELETAVLQITPVGSVIFRMDSINPSTIYGGEWELVTGASSLKFGNGEPLNGLVEGSSVKSVPLQQHSHDMEHTHTRGTMEITGGMSAPGYGYTSVGYSLTGYGAFAPSGGLTVLDKINLDNNQGSIYRSVDFLASRSWVGSTSTPSKSRTLDSGVSNAVLDVEGATISINAWKRVL